MENIGILYKNHLMTNKKNIADIAPRMIFLLPTVKSNIDKKNSPIPNGIPGFIFGQAPNLEYHDTFPIVLHFSIHRFCL